MALIHKFKQGDNFFVLDVNTGAVHIVECSCIRLSVLQKHKHQS